jgi:hypothetical protein
MQALKTYKVGEGILEPETLEWLKKLASEVKDPDPN